MKILTIIFACLILAVICFLAGVAYCCWISAISQSASYDWTGYHTLTNATSTRLEVLSY